MYMCVCVIDFLLSTLTWRWETVVNVGRVNIVPHKFWSVITLLYEIASTKLNIHLSRSY